MSFKKVKLKKPKKVKQFMEKVTLKLHEFFSLSAELEGVANQQTGEVLAKGLLSEKLKLTTKYWLSDLATRALTERNAIDKLKEDLIKKHGTADETGNFSIPMWINIVLNEDTKEIVSRDPNPVFTEFQNDFNALLNEERELSHHAFKLAEFENIETEGVYNTFFKLLKVEADI